MGWASWMTRPARRLVARMLLPRFTRPRLVRTASFSDLRHVAVVHWDNLGDAVLLGPVLRELRRALPEARIVLIHNARNAGVFAHCPYVDQLIPQEVQGPPGPGKVHGDQIDSRSSVFEAARLLRRVASDHGPIDLVVGPDWLNPVYTDSFFDSTLFRAGGGWRLLREAARSGRSVRVEQRQHHVARNLDILRALGAAPVDDQLELWTSDDEKETAARLVGNLTSPVVTVSPGAGAARRQWPAERMAEVARQLVTDQRASVVLVGGPDARPLVDGSSLVDLPGATDLVGRTSVGELAAVLQRSDLLIGNDSGPIHLAAAAGTPVVEVSMHPMDGEPWIVNSPNRYHPWRTPSVVLRPEGAVGDCMGAKTCRGPEPHCILGVGVGDVLRAARLLLQSDRTVTS